MNLYTEIILDHYKNPKNFGTLTHPTVSVKESNPLCGDKLLLDLKIGKNNIVEKVAFSGSGCAISMASMSMLTEKLIGKTLEDIRNIKKEDIFDMLKVEISPGRIKCALLGLTAAKKAVYCCLCKEGRCRE